jgi:hypothetical protein
MTINCINYSPNPRDSMQENPFLPKTSSNTCQETPSREITSPYCSKSQVFHPFAQEKSMDDFKDGNLF